MTQHEVPRLGVGMVGYAFMGRAHSQAWRVAPRFFDLPMRPEMAVLAGRSSPDALHSAAQTLGWADTETDWRDLVVRDDVDLVDIASPGDTHAEIAIAALEAGKHVLCEKPLANTVAEAEAMAAAAERAAARGVRAMVGFSFRRVPALSFARQLIAEGRIGGDPPGQGAVPAGLAGRPRLAADLAARQGRGRVRCARGHRGAHRRRRAVHSPARRSPE